MLPGLEGTMSSFLGGGGGSLEATVSPGTLTRSAGTHSGGKTLVTSPAVVSATGGAGGYTYAWVRTSGSASITAATPAAASTTFSATVAPEETLTAVFTCTITDAAGGNVSVTVHVTLTLIFNDPFGGTL